MMAAALVVAMGGTPGAAATLQVYSGITIFGDSLSDPGNAAALAAAAGRPFPPEFPLGKASDGPLWSERVAAEFTTRGLPARNFAFAAARVLPDDKDGLFPGINLPAQLRNFAAAAPAPLAPGHLALFWLGANDLRAALRDFDPQGNLLSEVATLATSAIAAATSLVQQATAVRAAGIHDILFVTAPDLSLTPAALLRSNEERALAQLATGIFNATLGAAVSALDLIEPDLRVSVFDINKGLIATLGNPDAFGVTNPLALSCLDAIGVPPPLDRLGECRAHFFYDDIHPSSTLHAALAADIRTVVAPIPLPAAGWLLLTGLVLLGGVARRRA